MSAPRVASDFALAVALRHAREGVDGAAAEFLRLAAERLAAGRPLPAEVAAEVAAMCRRIAGSGRARAALGITAKRRRPLDVGDALRCVDTARKVDALRAQGLSPSNAVGKVAERGGGEKGGDASVVWRRLRRGGGA